MESLSVCGIFLHRQLSHRTAATAVVVGFLAAAFWLTDCNKWGKSRCPDQLKS